MFYKSLLKPQIWTNAKNAQKWREGKTKHCSEKSIYFRDLVPIYFSGSLFSVFWLNLCKEGQFILHKCHMQLWENLCYWPSTITAKNYPFDAIVKHGVFVEKICKYTPPPVPRTHFFPSVFPTVSIHMLLSEISSCFVGQIFYWTIGIWPMTCLPVVNLEIPPHKSQSEISTVQSVHSSCALHGAMRSLCLPKGLEFGFANWKVSTLLSLFPIKMDSSTFSRKDI